MVDFGVINDSDAPGASPNAFVKKRDSLNMLCADHRNLNKTAVLDPQPMPKAEGLFHKISDDKLFSKGDLIKGNWQIKVSEEQIPKTAFVTPDGNWDFFLDCDLSWWIVDLI